MKYLVLLVALIIIVYAISWIAVCGLFYLLGDLLGFAFNWLLATVIWLFLAILFTPTWWK